MSATHGHRRYTMTAAAINQRRMARQARVKVSKNRPSRAGRSVGLHITPQAAAIIRSYKQGKKRREFLSAAILNHSKTANGGISH